MNVQFSEPEWLTIDDAVTHYGISRSSMDRWIRENPDRFVVKYENSTRYVDVANSRPPGNARLKGASMIPDGYITLGEAQEYYKAGRSTIHSWVRDGHLVVKMFGSKKYVDVKNSKAPNTRAEDVESWKEIPGFADYEACTDGRVRNKKTGKVLSPNLVHGYNYVHLYNDTSRQIIAIHRVVAITYIPNPDNKRTVNHKNHDPFDNRVENLEWYTHAEQNSHKRSTFKQKDIPEQDDLEDELWRPSSIDGYYISNNGRVCDKNYDVVNLSTNRRYFELRIKDNRLCIHREVARAFLPNFSKEMVVNHKDGNTHNNHVDNLEVVTQAENVLHAYETGRTSNRVSIIQKYPDGTVVKHKSIKEAALKTGLKKESIGYASKHSTNLGGYEWFRN